MAPQLQSDAAAVFIVDDDPSVCDALSLVFQIEGYAARAFGDAGSFLDAFRQQRPACVILDINLRGESGLRVLREIALEPRPPPPVLAISGQGDVATVVAAIKCGAIDFLQKPFAVNVMADRVREAVALDLRSREKHIEGLAHFAGRHRLTGRECDVLRQVTQGASNKEAGRQLGISPRTVEVHRARIMDKLGAKNAADLMRIVLSEELSGHSPRHALPGTA